MIFEYIKKMTTITCDQIPKVDLQMGEITLSKTGAKTASIGVGADLKQLRIILAKSPTLTTPFVPTAFDGGDRVSFDIRAQDPVEGYIDKLDALILQYVTKHKERFFKSPPSDGDLARLYTPLKKQASDMKYSNLIRTKMTLGDKPSAKFWGADKKPLDPKTINWRNSEFGVQVRLKSIWFQANRSFGACLEVEHVLVQQTDQSCPFEVEESSADLFS